MNIHKRNNTKNTVQITKKHSKYMHNIWKMQLFVLDFWLQKRWPLQRRSRYRRKRSKITLPPKTVSQPLVWCIIIIRHASLRYPESFVTKVLTSLCVCMRQNCMLVGCDRCWRSKFSKIHQISSNTTTFPALCNPAGIAKYHTIYILHLRKEIKSLWNIDIH